MKKVAMLTMLAAVLALSAGALAGGGGGGGVSLEFSLAAEPVTVTVSGRVTDAATGKPLADALVRGHVLIWAHMGPELFEKAPYQVTRTDADGGYELKFVTALTRTGAMKGKDSGCVYVSKPGYETRPQYVKPRVTPGKTEFAGVDIPLEKGRCLRGKVVDEDGSPIPVALVKAQNGMNGDWSHFGSMGEVRTARDGTFELWVAESQKAGDYLPRWLEFWKEGYGVAFAWDLSDDDIGEIVIRRGATISGRVTDAAGKGVADCEVAASTMMWYIVGKATTDADGRYEIDAVPGKPGVVEFFKAKNKQWMDLWGEVTVYARSDPDMKLGNVPHYKLIPEEGKTTTGPELVVGLERSVSGTLVAGSNAFGLRGLMVRLDHDWNNMVAADADGRFEFPYVSPGKHRLTAYIPHNLRGDRGIGSTEITVEAGAPLEGVRIELLTLSEVRVQFVDADGNPIDGITAGATWRKDGGGFWTEGTVSGSDGWTVLYLYADSKQYVRGFDHAERKLVAAGYREVTPVKGEVIDNVRIAMVAAAGIAGRFVDGTGAAIASKKVKLSLSYADGGMEEIVVNTDEKGSFKQEPRLRPGVVTLAAETVPPEFAGTVDTATEVAPGGVTDLGEIALKRVKFHKVAGRVVPSESVTKVDGLKIRLNLTGPWQIIGETDSQGNFQVEVPEGRHRLTAYVLWNQRFDAGIGHTYVEAAGNVEGVELPLDNLAVLKMTIVDESGKPLAGISGITAFRADGSGPGNEGPPSDENGLSTIYVYPDHTEFAFAFDKVRKCRSKEATEIRLSAGQVMEITVVMAPDEE